jgi:crotonobetainyl-CoA:carnitine CoA-transferase CaiB-like acyl-CoA transferase
VWIDAGEQSAPQFCGVDVERLRGHAPRLIAARLSPFGPDGPWAGFKGGDLIQLALGGVIMNNGYDPGLDGRYDTPPSWPHAFHSAHISGEQLAMAIIAGLYWREQSGQGQVLDCAMHEAVSKSTEVDLMSWVMLRTPFHRLTGRHSAPEPSAPTMAATKDGRWMNAMTLSEVDRKKLRAHIASLGLAEDHAGEAAAPNTARNVPGTGKGLSEESQRDIELIGRLTRRTLFDDVPWMEGQAAGLVWSPVRKPHENADDPHWRARGTFAEVHHAAAGVDATYPVSKWRSSTSCWRTGEAAPDLGDDHGFPELWLAGAGASREHSQGREHHQSKLEAVRPRERQETASGRRWSLDGVRIFDFSWVLASAGGTRFLAAMGADCIKVEWAANPDTRLGAGAPIGGRAARLSATGSLPENLDPDMGGNFNHKNAGKRGISLNVRHPEGLRIAKELIKLSDVVAEGFSPGVMDRWGLGYDVLESLRPGIIYAQQSGMGAAGTYGRTRAVGPIAAALSGVTDMSGQPNPAPPAGWGYSYLDWMGAYSFASAILAALYEREITGRGQWIDASQCEVGIFASALPIVDWSVNGTTWERTGNHSPYRPASPEGIYRCSGEDRWVAISCGNEESWLLLLDAIGQEGLADDERFATLKQRLAHRDELDRLVGDWTADRDRYEVMEELQRRGVPSGVCQTAEDRCDRDPQLAHLGWLTEVTGTKIGTWPVGEAAVRMSATPPYIGGVIDRGAPCYGEDNYEVYGKLLGLSVREIDQLKADGVI